MIFISDPFVRPENLVDIKKSIEILEYQVKTAEALEHAKDRLSKTATLDANTLAKCRVFICYVNNSETASNFGSEVSKLSLNELAFVSISFEERRLKAILDLFKASDIRKYVEKQNINCLHRPEIFKRIKYILAGCEGSRFRDIYSAVLQAKDSGESDMVMNEKPEPRTAAEEPNAFKLLGVRREGLKKVFPEHIANAARLMTVESRYPRRESGDAFISFDLESDRGPVAALLDALMDGDNPVVEIPEVFGHTIATSIDRCDLRNWEKEKGCMDTTNCVKMKMIYRVDLRICDDATIAHILHS